MQTATLDDLTTRGSPVMAHLHPGDAVTILKDGKAVALLLGLAPSSSEPRPLGCYAGQIGISADFNEPLPEIESAVAEPIHWSKPR